MGSKVLARVLIVLLAALLIFRINQRVEMYRVPRENCQIQMYNQCLSILSQTLAHIMQYDQ